MAIEYLGLSNINGPLVVLEGVQNAFFDEIVEFVVEGNIKKMGRIVELNEDKAIIQVFEGTENMSLQNTHTKLTGLDYGSGAKRCQRTSAEPGAQRISAKLYPDWNLCN